MFYVIDDLKKKLALEFGTNIDLLDKLNDICRPDEVFSFG